MKGLVLSAWPLVATGLVSCVCVALLLLRCGVALLLCGAAVLCRACGVASLLLSGAAVLRRADRGEVGSGAGSAMSDRRFGASGLLEGVAVTLALALPVWLVVLVVALAERASCLFRLSISLCIFNMVCVALESCF